MNRALKENNDPLGSQKSSLSSKDDKLDDDKSYIKTLKDRYEKEIAKKPHNSIELWLKYLEWSEELLATNDISSDEIQKLYNKAMQACKHNKTYRDDPRLLELFLKYIRGYVKQKPAWFEWLVEHKYCQKLASFYIEWSKVFGENDKQSSLKVLHYALEDKNVLDQEQFKIVLNYLNEFRASLGMESFNPEYPERIKISYDFNMVYDQEKQCEFQFEEVRYNKYTETFENNKKLQAENEELKAKLAEALAIIEQLKLNSKLEEGQEIKVKEMCEIATNTSIINPVPRKQMNKTRDSFNKTNQRQSSILGTTTYNTTEAFNNTNFTNVTRFNMDEDSMSITDEDMECKENKSIAPLPMTSALQAPPELSITGHESMVTLANIRNSMATTFAETTFANKTLTVKTSEAKRIANEMFNQTTFDSTQVAQETLPSISIYKDNQTLSEPSVKKVKQEIEKKTDCFNDENEKLPSKNLNQDGSLFVYDQTKQTIQESNKRKPLGVLSDTLPDCTFEEESEKSVFEPRLASTRSIRPFLNKINEMGYNVSKLETIIDSSFEKAVKNEEQKIKNDMDEKEKMLNAHLGENEPKTDEKNLSKILSQDFETQCTKWTNCKTQKEVKFGNINGSVTRKNINRTGITNMSSGSFDYDYEYLDVESNQKQQQQQSLKYNMTECQTLADFTIQNITAMVDPTLPVFSQADKTEKIKLPDEDDDYEKGLLSQDKLEKTFNNDYYKLCYNQSYFNSTSLNVSKIIIDKIMDNERYEENQKENTIIEENKTILEPVPTMGNQDSSSTTVSDKSDSNDFTESKIDSTICDSNNQDGSDLSSNTTSVTSSSLSITNANLNQTVMTAIKEPFNIEIKNRLLNKGPLENLKNNPNFVSLKINAPFIKENTLVTLNDGVEYKVLDEIGKGSFAKIYLIEKKDKSAKIALKVDKQATSWEFYITEVLHERLSKMLNEDKIMNVNVMSSFIRMNQFMKYQNGCFSAMNYYKNGSLLDLINFHVINEKQYSSFPYWFVLYLTMEMLYIIQYLHKAKIIHADIKPDNLIVNCLPDSFEYFEKDRTKCLVLIDFNRSIDLNLLGQNAEFDAKVDNKSLLIPEMKEEKPWTYQVDFYGILCSIHCVIFKKYMKTYKEKCKDGIERNRFNGSFPRGYDKLFDNLFDTYLNVPSCTQFPDLEANFISKFRPLFLTEMAMSFSKSKQYLVALNEHFKKKQI